MNMIQANELRIGNLVLINGEYIEIKDIDSFGINSYRDCDFESNDYDGYFDVVISNNPRRTIFLIEPIPLTKEWLLKFGFRYNKAEETYFLPIPNLKMEIHAAFFMEVYVLELHNHLMPIVTECDSVVHQLQNLYFALTNKELEIS